MCVYYNRRTRKHVAIANKKQDPVIVDLVVPIGQFEQGVDQLRVNQVFFSLSLVLLRCRCCLTRALVNRC